MSRPCIYPPCGRMLPDSAVELACPSHWLRLSHVTRDRLITPGPSADGYLAVITQALLEMRRTPPLLQDAS